MSEWSMCDTSKHTRVSIFGRYGTGPGLAVWHVDCVKPLENAVHDALKTKYGQEMTKKGVIWTLACREIRGGTGHSEHSHPIAIDVNPPTNPMRDDGILRTDFAKFGMEDGVAFVNAFKKQGFRWGADWSTNQTTTESVLKKNGQKARDGRVDPMHFEYTGAPTNRGRGGRPSLERGDGGSSVTTLQKLLKKHGCDPGDIDGAFGANTLKAVRAFQEMVGLEVDGIVGPDTWKALMKSKITLPKTVDAYVLRWREKPGAPLRERVFLKLNELIAYMRHPRARKWAEAEWQKKAIKETEVPA